MKNPEDQANLTKFAEEDEEIVAVDVPIQQPDGTFTVTTKPVTVHYKSQNVKTTSWGKCPICGEDDMRHENENDGAEISTYIHCVNTNCGSNGGDNYENLRVVGGVITHK